MWNRYPGSLPPWAFLRRSWAAAEADIGPGEAPETAEQNARLKALVAEHEAAQREAEAEPEPEPEAGPEACL
jgi:hypothetical protein